MAIPSPAPWPLHPTRRLHLPLGGGNWGRSHAHSRHTSTEGKITMSAETIAFLGSVAAGALAWLALLGWQMSQPGTEGDE